MPRPLRRDLDRLERLSARPVTHARDIESAERTLAEYEECLEVAIAFSDHVARERVARWRQQRRWLRWAMAGAGSVFLLTVLVVVGELQHQSFSAGASLWCQGDVCSYGPYDPSLAALALAPPASDADCAARSACKAFGECALLGGVGGVCRPTSEAHCRESMACTQRGVCSLQNDQCVAPDAGNPCGLSVECAQHGRCATAPDGCYANNDQDCGASWDCQLDGLCQFVDGHCAAETDDDCASSRECKLAGHCRAQGGRCLAIDDLGTAKHGVTANLPLERDSRGSE
ncbi:MAG TPA: hypothetical protein VNN80_25990 [Polyangiaceae bacterium]|nr:hypothetical protein [Polyangiaceae bacterium]